MRLWNWRRFFMALMMSVASVGMIGACDSGKKVVDEVTGNRAVKQYHKSKKDLRKIADQQAERYSNIPDDGDQKDDDQQ